MYIYMRVWIFGGSKVSLRGKEGPYKKKVLAKKVLVKKVLVKQVLVWKVLVKKVLVQEGPCKERFL